MVEIINGYLYPFRGILYMIKKKQLRKNSYLPIIFSLIIDIIALVLMFKFTYVPQFDLINGHILTFFWRWLNKVITFIIVMIEVYIIAMIVINIFLGYFFEKAFDEVLILKGYHHLIEQEDSDCLKSCLRSVRIFQLIKVFVAIITLPLNFVPTLGSIAYYFLNGLIQGWDQQDRYFQLKKINTLGDEWKFIKSHFKNMLTYGVVSFFLESLPIIGVVFNISNAVGIALYDCHLEKKYGGNDDKNSECSTESISEEQKPTQEINTKKVKNYGSNNAKSK